MTSKTAQILNYFSEKSPSQDFIMGTLDATPQTAYHSIALWWWSITCAKVAHKVQKVIGWSLNVLSAFHLFCDSNIFWKLLTLWVTFLKIILLVLVSSKCLFSVSNFFQKNERKQVDIVVKFVCFLEETSAWKNHRGIFIRGMEY